MINQDPGAHSWHFSLFRSRKEVFIRENLNHRNVFISIVAICMKANKVIFCFTLDPPVFFSYLVFLLGAHFQTI